MIRLTVILFFSIYISNVYADVTKTACISAFGHSSQSEVKKELLALAKRAAVEELFGSFVKSFTQVKNFSLQEDDIETYSAGFVRIKGNPVYSNGKGLGEICIKITAHVTEADWKKIQPKEISKKTCELEGDIKTIKKRTEEKSKLEVLFDYDQKLKEFSPKKVLPLLREVKFSEGDFVSGTPVYCIRATGLIFPIEVSTLKSNKVTKPVEKFVKGLQGKYFNLPPFSKSPSDFKKPSFNRIDKSINFRWDVNDSPAPNISADYFGIRWTGMIHITTTGTYLIKGLYEDGMKLSIDNSTIIDSWNSCGGCSVESNIYLESNKWYPIKIEFFHVKGDAQIKIYWRKPGDSSLEIIPSDYLKTENTTELQEKQRPFVAK